MKNKFPLLRFIFSFPAMLTVLLMIFVSLLTIGKAHDPDIWWHLRNAEYLFETHHFPNVDMFSFTVAGHPWLNYEWLGEIPFYLAWRAGGLAGIWAAWVVLVELIVLSLLYLCYRTSGNIKASLVACGFCSILTTVSYGARTILFGYLCMILLLIVLESFRATGRARLWVLPPLFCVWANTHGSWLIGLVVFGLIGVSGLIGGEWGFIESKRWTASQLKQLIVTGLASVAALFVNPFGWRIVAYPFQFASKQTINVTNVEEWASINFHENLGMIAMVLLLGLLVGILVSGRRWRLGDVALLLLAFYSGLVYVRFVFFIAIVAAPVLAILLDFIPPYEPEIDKHLLNAILMVVVISLTIHNFPWQTQLSLETKLAETYPVDILPYLRTHPLQGNVLNFDSWGGFLIWYARDIKVFLDSRFDIYEYAGVFGDYVDLINIRSPQRILDKYAARYVLFPKASKLTSVLQHDAQWKVQYQDSVAILFERTTLAPQ